MDPLQTRTLTGGAPDGYRCHAPREQTQPGKPWRAMDERAAVVTAHDGDPGRAALRTGEARRRRKNRRLRPADATSRRKDASPQGGLALQQACPLKGRGNKDAAAHGPLRPRSRRR